MIASLGSLFIDAEMRNWRTSGKNPLAVRPFAMRATATDIRLIERHKLQGAARTCGDTHKCLRPSIADFEMMRVRRLRVPKRTSQRTTLGNFATPR